MSSSLRSHLEAVQEEVLRIEKEVDPMTQVGDLCSQSDKPLLFENIKGYPQWRICDLLIKSRKTQAIALGTTPDNVLPELARRFAEAPGKTGLIKDGPVKEKVLMDEKVDLAQLPVCIHNPKDGGPYIGAGLCVVKDPDTGVQNVAHHRMQVKSKNHTGLGVYSPDNVAIIKKYHDKNEPAPMAVVIGHHPCYEIAAAYYGPHHGFGEFELAASLINETVELVTCETSDIEVPAHAEIVIEGEVPPGVLEEEGPFVEFYNFYASGVTMRPVLNVKCISMRNDAIYRHLNVTPYTDCQSISALPVEARLFEELKRKGLLVHDVFIPPWGGLFLTIIKMTPRLEEEVREMLYTVLFSPVFLPSLSKVVIAVDDDVDIYNARDFIYSLGTRINPETDVITVSNILVGPFDFTAPEISGSQGRQGFFPRSGGRLAIDATRPSLAKAENRARLERINPNGWGGVFLKDFVK